MKSAVVVGTKHSVQRGEDQKDIFESYLNDLVKKYDIKAIAEEINENANTVVSKSVCNKFNIIHKIIEPNPIEYDALNIEHIHKIDYEFMNVYDLESPPSSGNSCSSQVTKDYNFRIQKTFRAREKEWLKRIQFLNIWPVLIICGASHVEFFCKLLIENSINVTLDEPSWGC